MNHRRDTRRCAQTRRRVAERVLATVRSGRTVRALLAATVLAVTVGACSVTTNDHPETVGPIFDPLQEPTTTTTTTIADGPSRSYNLFYLQSSGDSSVKLATVERDLPIDSSPSQVLTNLFESRPDSDDPDEAELFSAIPDSAELLSAELEPNTTNLIVDTRGLGLQGEELRRAAAQIVFTATSLQSVSSVTFRDDGNPVGILIGSGEPVDRAVSRSDYTELR